MILNWFGNHLDSKGLNQFITKIENGLLTGDNDKETTTNSKLEKEQESEALHNIRKVVKVMSRL